MYIFVQYIYIYTLIYTTYILYRFLCEIVKIIRWCACVVVHNTSLWKKIYFSFGGYTLEIWNSKTSPGRDVSYVAHRTAFTDALRVPI